MMGRNPIGGTVLWHASLAIAILAAALLLFAVVADPASVRAQDADAAGDAPADGPDAPQTQPEPQPLSIEPAIPTLRAGQVGLEYPPLQLDPTGGRAPYTWALAETSGPLPAGMFFLDGAIQGTPEETGDFEFTVALTDADGMQARWTYRLTIYSDPFELEEMPANTFDGTVGRDEYSDTAPIRIGLGNDGEAQVYLRQSGGALNVAMRIEHLFTASNVARIYLAPESLRQVNVFEFMPAYLGVNAAETRTNAAQTVVNFRQVRFVQSATNPARHRMPPPARSATPGSGPVEVPVENWLAKANGQRPTWWECEFRINLSEIGIVPGTDNGPLRIAFEIFTAPNGERVAAPPRDESNPIYHPSGYRTLTSLDNWGPGDRSGTVTQPQVLNARRIVSAANAIYANAMNERNTAYAAYQEFAIEIQRQLDSGTIQEPGPETLEQLRRELQQVDEAQRKYISAMEMMCRLDGNYFPYLLEVARAYSRGAQNPLPGQDPRELWQLALRHAEAVLIYCQDYLPAQLLRAQSLRALGQLDRSLALYELIEMTNPDVIPVQLEIIRVQILRSQRARAAAMQLEDAIAEQDTAIEDAAAALADATEAGQPALIEARQQILEDARAELEQLQARLDEVRQSVNEFRYDAFGRCDAIVTRAEADPRVALAVSVMLNSLGVPDDALRYLDFAIAGALQQPQIDLAVNIVAFLGDQRQFAKLSRTLDQLTAPAEPGSGRTSYADSFPFHYRASQELAKHHFFQAALAYMLQADALLDSQELPQNPRARQQQISLRNEVDVDLMIAQANAGHYDVATELWAALEPVLSGGDGDTAGQTHDAYSQLQYYSSQLVPQELAARQRDRQQRGTPRENPYVTMFVTGSDGLERPVLIEMFRSDATSMVEAVLELIQVGWYDQAEAGAEGNPSDYALPGFAITRVRRADGIEITARQPLPADAPLEFQASNSARYHFRGTVSLPVTSAGKVGMPMSINTAANPQWNEIRPVIGRVIVGMDVLDNVYDAGARTRFEVGNPAGLPIPSAENDPLTPPGRTLDQYIESDGDDE